MRAVVLGAADRIATVRQHPLLRGLVVGDLVFLERFVQAEAVVAGAEVGEVLLRHHSRTGKRLCDIGQLLQFFEFYWYIQPLRVQSDHRGPDVLLSGGLLHVLLAVFVGSILAAHAKVAHQWRLFVGFFGICLEQMGRVNGGVGLGWVLPAPSPILNALSRLGKAVDIFNLYLFALTLTINIKHVEIFPAVVNEKRNASLFLERAFLHIESHCHLQN